MPNETFSPEEKKKIEAWFRKHWDPKLKCPICGSETWTYADRLAQPVTVTREGGLILGGGIGYPVLAVISEPCGYTVYFNAVVMGLMPAPPEETKNAAGS